MLEVIDSNWSKSNVKLSDDDSRADGSIDKNVHDVSLYALEIRSYNIDFLQDNAG